MSSIGKIIDNVNELNILFDKNKNLKREFSPFCAEVLENLDINIYSISGWSIIYPAYSETWVYIMSWLDKWDKDNRTSLENFIKGIAFPCSVRLSDVDAKYVDDIINAHTSLTQRVLLKNKNSEDELEEQDSDEY